MVPTLFLQLAAELGAGVLIGVIVGFIAKNMARTIAVIIGVELVVYQFLKSRGVIMTDWTQLSNPTADAQTATSAESWIVTLISTTAVGAGFALGFFVMFRRS